MLHHQQSGYSPTHLNGLRCLLELSQAIKVSITEAYGSSTSAQDSCPCQSYSGITPRDLQCSSHNVTTTTVIGCRDERPFYFWISVFSFCFIIAVLFKILEKTIFFKRLPPCGECCHWIYRRVLRTVPLMSFMIFCSISLLQGLALLNQTPQIKQKVLCLQILSWIITLTITMLMFKRPLMR